MSETLKKMDTDPQIERLAPDQAKGEVESDKALDSFCEVESMGAQPHGENERPRKPTFDFWDQDFPQTWSPDLGMDALTFQFIKMYERQDMAKHNAKPEVKAK